MKALTEYRHELLENSVKIFVRRGGPNYQEGLRVMREVGELWMVVKVLMEADRPNRYMCVHCVCYYVYMKVVCRTNQANCRQLFRWSSSALCMPCCRCTYVSLRYVCLGSCMYVCTFSSTGSKLGLQIHVFGPETHMTAIVSMALGQRSIPKPAKPEQPQAQPMSLLGSKNVSISIGT